MLVGFLSDHVCVRAVIFLSHLHLMYRSVRLQIKPASQLGVIPEAVTAPEYIRSLFLPVKGPMRSWTAFLWCSDDLLLCASNAKPVITNMACA